MPFYKKDRVWPHADAARRAVAPGIENSRDETPFFINFEKSKSQHVIFLLDTDSCQDMLTYSLSRSSAITRQGMFVHRWKGRAVMLLLWLPLGEVLANDFSATDGEEPPSGTEARVRWREDLEQQIVTLQKREEFDFYLRATVEFTVKDR